MGFFLLTAFSNNNFPGSCCKYVADEPKVSPSAAPQLMSSVDFKRTFETSDDRRIHSEDLYLCLYLCRITYDVNVFLINVPIMFRID